MNPLHLVRRVLSWLPFGKSPQQVPRVNIPTTYAVGTAPVPAPLEERTRRISTAQARAEIGESVDFFPARPQAPRTPVRPEVPNDSGDEFDRNTGGHHLRRFL